jgi:hypothetical protein
MKWIKQGLIFVPDGSKINMISHAAIPFADILNDDTIRIYFSSRNSIGQSIPYYIDVNRSNPSIIKKIHEFPIIPLGDLGTFDDSGIMPSWVTTYNDKKFMYYIGWNPQVTVSYRLSIGLAISSDGGNTYKKYSSAPICDRSLEEPFFNTAPCVLVINDKWKMWYISCTGWERINDYPEPKYHVKYAESDDGINWNKTGKVCIDYDIDAEAIGRPSILYENGLYRMWFSYRKISNYRFDRSCSYRIGYAESLDGINWIKKNEESGIDVSNTQSWDYEMITYSHVLNDKINNTSIMFYNGNGFGKSGFGYAISK